MMTPDDEITIMCPIEAKPEFRASVREKILALAVQARAEKGNVCYVLHDAKDNPNLIMIYEKWKNQAALDEHMGRDYLKAFVYGCADLLARPAFGTICHEFSR